MGSYEDELRAIELEAKRLQLAELRRAVAEREERESLEKAARMAGVDSARLAMKQQAAKEANCSHLKRNGASHLAGQKDHSGVLHLICQYCQKEFVGGEIPTYLYPDMETVGGPHL